MIDLSSIMTATIGQTRPFQILSYTMKRSPILGDTGMRLGTSIEISGEGIVEADTPAAFTAAIAALTESTDRDGQDLVITGLAGLVEAQLLSAQCVENGPHFDLELSDGTAPMQKKIRFKVAGATAAKPDDGEDDGVADEYSVTTDVKVDDRQVITYSGNLVGPNLAAWINGVKVPAVRNSYPWPDWTLTYTWATKETGGVDSASYSIVVTETSDPLPGKGTTRALSGTMTVSTETNSQWQKVTTQQSEFTVDGDFDALHDSLRPQDVLIVQETKEIEFVSGNTLRSRFTYIEGSEGDLCIGFDQTLSLDAAEPVYEEKLFPGSDPLLVRLPKRYRRLRQSGSIRGGKSFFLPPDPILELLAEPMDVSLSDPQAIEKVTSWSYVMFVPSDITGTMLPDLVKKIGRPSKPTIII